MIKNLFKLLRVHQWVKNIFVFVPLIFSKNLLNENLVLNTFLAFITFNLVASIVYIINDIFDKDVDKNHPIKKNRPIASGEVSSQQALLFIALLLIPVVLLLITFNILFILLVILYVFINIAYSIKLKQIVILDIFLIASGFMIRVISGAYAIDVYVSSWLILTTLFLSLFLAVLKRRSELELYEGENNSRKVLSDYSIEFINYITTISSAGVVICYALYTVSDHTINAFNTENFVYTTIFVLFGIYRYYYLVIRNKTGENILKILLSDKQMLINSFIYVAIILFLIYWFYFMVKYTYIILLALIVYSCGSSSEISVEEQEVMKIVEDYESNIDVDVDDLFCWILKSPGIDDDPTFHVSGELEIEEDKKYDFTILRLSLVKIYQNNLPVFVLSPVVRENQKNIGSDYRKIIFTSSRDLTKRLNLDLEENVDVELLFKDGDKSFTFKMFNISIEGVEE